MKSFGNLTYELIDNEVIKSGYSPEFKQRFSQNETIVGVVLRGFGHRDCVFPEGNIKWIWTV